MINSIEAYLAELKKELSGSDRATIQDALSDAEEYLRTAMDGAASDKAHLAEAEALAPIIERYGQPAEVAAAYKAMEHQTPPAFGRAAANRVKPAPPAVPVPPSMPAAAPAAPAVPDNRNFFAKFFGVFADPKAWGGLLLILFVFVTGIIYFTWAVTGISVSAGLIVLIIGLPIFALFLMSVRGIAVIEGRLIEALTGVRMPRRPLFTRSDIGFWQKVKKIFSERQTWTAFVYMILQMPLGIIYFTVAVSLLSSGVWLIFRPIAELAWGVPAWYWDGPVYTYAWAMPFSVIGGALLITATLHLMKYIARFHAGFAKIMLVRE